jgi:hypothetical protein
MKQTAQWALTVSADLERRVRRYLESAERKGELSAFVEEAVRARLLQLTMKTAYSKPSANDVAVPPAESEDRSEGSYGG